jgi:hypothetical protein
MPTRPSGASAKTREANVGGRPFGGGSTGGEDHGDLGVSWDDRHPYRSDRRKGRSAILFIALAPSPLRRFVVVKLDHLRGIWVHPCTVTLLAIKLTQIWEMWG